MEAVLGVVAAVIGRYTTSVSTAMETVLLIHARVSAVRFGPGSGQGPADGCVMAGELGGLPEAARVGVRAVAVGWLLELRGNGRLSSDHVRLAAGALGVSERTVWRWLAAPDPGPGAVRGVWLPTWRGTSTGFQFQSSSHNEAWRECARRGGPDSNRRLPS